MHKAAGPEDCPAYRLLPALSERASFSRPGGRVAAEAKWHGNPR
jgi:hypothetical protein